MILTLFGCQRSLIYYPRPYPAHDLRYLPKEVEPVVFQTSQGEQTCFYRRPAGPNAGTSERLWLIFNGNATNSLDWLDFLERVDPAVGVLLIEYPGYGSSEGKPSRKAIAETADAAYAALLGQLNVTEADMQGRIGLLGQSLGSAAALEFATRHRAKRIILLSPFTSLRDMARMVVGWPLCNLLLDRFDNRAALRTLAASDSPPEVFVFHGTADDVVPVRMGRQLANEFPQMVKYQDVPNVDHNWISIAVEAQLLELMKPGSTQ